MEVFVIEQDFGRYLDVYVMENLPNERRQTVWAGINEHGSQEFQSVTVLEGVRMAGPSFSIPRLLVGPLVDALTDHTPTKIDKTVFDMLSKETERVDKFVNYLVRLDAEIRD